jgi:hypothetical protein
LHFFLKQNRPSTFLYANKVRYNENVEIPGSLFRFFDLKQGDCALEDRSGFQIYIDS